MNINGSITTGPLSSTVGDIASFSNTSGSIQDSGILSFNLVTLNGTLTNKTLRSGDNSIIISSGTIPLPTNINSLVDQDVRQGSNPIFNILI